MEVETNKEIVLVFGAAITIVLYAILFAVLAPTIFTSPLSFILIFIGSIAWLVMVAVALALSTKNKSLLIIVSIAVVVTLLAGRFSIGAIAGALLLGLSLISARHILTQDLKERLTYRTRTTFKGGVKVLVVGLLLSISGLTVSLISETIEAEGLKIPESIVEPLLAPSEKIIQGLLPGFKSDASLDTLIDTQLQQQLGEQVSLDLFLPDNQRTNIRDDISRQLNLPSLSGRETLTTIATNKINSSLQAITKTNSLLVSFMIIALGLIAVRALVGPLSWLVLLLGLSPFIWLGKRFGLWHVVNEQTTVERLKI